MLVKFENESIEVRENEEHMFLVSNYEVAKGYGISETTLRRHKSNNEKELIEGTHFLTVHFLNSQNLGVVLHPKVREQTFWTKRGVIRLGFFIKSERAKKFRDWAEDLILNSIEQKVEEQKEDEQENQVFPQMEFVFMVNNELRVSHCSIAEEIDYDEKLILSAITRHFEYS